MQTQQQPAKQMPLYRLLGPCYLEDDTLHGEGEEIIYLGVPNEDMEPLNDAAIANSTAYINELDDAAAIVAASRQMPFIGRQALMEQAMEHAQNEAKQHGKNLVLPAWRGDAPERPDLATPAQRQAREQRQPAKVLGTKPSTPKGKGNRTGSVPVLGSGLTGDAYAEATAGKPKLAG